MHAALLLVLVTADAMVDTRPPLSDAERLPPLPYLAAGWKTAKEYRDDLRRVYDTWPSDLRKGEVAAALEEAHRLADWYDYAYYARDPSQPADTRRNWLHHLCIVHPASYYSGDWPPCVPYWRLPRR